MHRYLAAFEREQRDPGIPQHACDSDIGWRTYATPKNQLRKNGGESSKRRDKPLRSTDSIIRRFEPGLLAVRRSLAGRGAIAGKLRMHDVGYPVGFRLNDRKNDHRDREKHGQDQNSETPFLEKAVLFPTRPVEWGMHGCLHKAAVPVPV